MSEEKIRKVDLSGLPRYYKGINWKLCIGKKVKFIYDDIEGEVEILNYKDNYLTIDYLGKSFKIRSTGFTNCNFGEMLNKKTSNFKINIGSTIGNLFITDRMYKTKIKYNKDIEKEKWYKYRCLICGFNGEIIEGALKKEIGCSVCNNKKVVEGINDIPTTAPWMVKYFQGGYDEAKRYTKSSSNEIEFKCPNCGRIKKKTINSIYNDKSIGCTCGDGFSYPEKFMSDILNQLNVDFITQLNKTTFKWCDKYRYDFYISSLSMIIETHGMQHYKERSKNSKFKSLKEQQESDGLKRELALANGIENYIELDCRYSELEWIKKSILNSKLNELFDLKDIDWGKGEEFALKNLTHEVCDFFNKNKKLRSYELAKIFNLSETTVKKYINIGKKKGWCGSFSDLTKKKIEVSKDGVSLGVFESAMYLEKNSLDIFGTKFYNSNISSVCKGDKEYYKGYKFNFV